MDDVQRERGAIAWMARNSVAANLLMAVIVLAGIAGMFRVSQEVFPTFDLDIVSVHVPYPGASPTEGEQGIVLAVEEALRGLDGVKRVSSTAGEGFAQVRAELLLGTDKDKVLSDVKTAVDRVTTLPLEAEEPNVTLVSGRQQVVSLVVSGEQELGVLHALAEDIRLRLLESPDVTQVDLQGVRPLEVSIEVPQRQLEAYALTLDQVAAQVRAASLELPGGSLKTAGGEVLVRVSDRRLQGHEFADIPLRGTASGASVRLGDIATITDGYADVDLSSYYDGRPAVRIVAYRIGEETPQRVSDAVHSTLEELEPGLPAGIHINIWDDDSALLADRINLLTRNARLGMLLVLLVLAAFLDLRLAFWVGLGIPISVLGALALMPMADVSINMVSLFAFIVTLGMVVDDAIVVGENIYEKENEGASRPAAAVAGAREMIVPVTFAILTTIVAFSPLLVVPGVMGKIFRIMPILVILVLVFSWIESFFVLPAHLAHDYSRIMRLVPPLRSFNRLVERARQPIARGLAWFSADVYHPLALWLVKFRYAAVAGGAATFLLSVGLVGAGIVPFSFFPKLEGDLVSVAARLPYGTPVERTAAVQQILEQSAMQAIQERASGEEGEQDVFRGMYTSLGSGPAARNGLREDGAHLVTVELQLVPTSERTFSSKEFIATWTEATPPIAGLESLVFQSSVGPGAGAAVDVQLSHPDTEVLEQAAAEVFGALQSYAALTDYENGFASGKPQLDFSLQPAAATLGLTGNDVARQLRSAFFGAEALREQRGRNEIKAMVRLPSEERDSEFHLERMLIRSPAGGMVPLSHVAAFRRGRAPTTINREDGRRVVNVKAELSAGASSSRDVLESLEEDAFPGLRDRFPGLTIDFAGEQREQGEVFRALMLNFLLAMVVMYAMLAIPFRSYIQPIIVMAAIPMGFVGAVGGHLIMGYGLSIISMFGIVALAGVVVNDSLVLIDATNRYRRNGASAEDAAIQGGIRRLRPILLTSLTTFFGLAPMIVETSVQARFLIPMAISLGFGVLFATLAILLLVPPLYMIIEDVTGFFSRITSPEEEAPPLPR